jgi:hypothetical protein
MKAKALVGVFIIIHIVALAAQECQKAPVSKASVAYGIVASAKKYVNRGGNVRSWWTQDTLGAGTYQVQVVYPAQSILCTVLGVLLPQAWPCR